MGAVPLEREVIPRRAIPLVDVPRRLGDLESSGAVACIDDDPVAGLEGADELPNDIDR